jgi:hypothetical protein
MMSDGPPEPAGSARREYVEVGEGGIAGIGGVVWIDIFHPGGDMPLWLILFGPGGEAPMTHVLRWRGVIEIT